MSSAPATKPKPKRAHPNRESGQEVAKQKFPRFVPRKSKTSEPFRIQRLEIGCPGRDRTYDQVINSHLLYR